MMECPPEQTRGSKHLERLRTVRRRLLECQAIGGTAHTDKHLRVNAALIQFVKERLKNGWRDQQHPSV